MNQEALLQLLDWVRLEDGLRSLDEIVSCASQWHPGVVFTCVEMERTAEHCLSAGWIRVLSEQDSENDRQRWQNDPNQNWTEDGLYQPGRIDFTPDGWAVYAALIEKRPRGSDAPLRYGVRYLWRTPGVVSALSLSERQLQEEKTVVLTGQDELTGGGLCTDHTIGEIIGPYSIGPWWVNRFVQAAIGYRLDILFDPPDKHF